MCNKLGAGLESPNRSDPHRAIVLSDIRLLGSKEVLKPGSVRRGSRGRRKLKSSNWPDQVGVILAGAVLATSAEVQAPCVGRVNFR